MKRTPKTRHFTRLFAVIAIGFALLLSACEQSSNTTGNATDGTTAANTTAATTSAADETSASQLTLTLAELAEYNGMDGKPAYVAVDGLIYDFTELGGWEGGKHNGYEAGTDLTEAIDAASPHGRGVLDRAPVVGSLVEP